MGDTDWQFLETPGHTIWSGAQILSFYMHTETVWGATSKTFAESTTFKALSWLLKASRRPRELLWESFLMMLVRVRPSKSP